LRPYRLPDPRRFVRVDAHAVHFHTVAAGRLPGRAAL